MKAKHKMASITARLGVQTALRSEILAATGYNVNLGDSVYVFGEDLEIWNAPYKVDKLSGEEFFL